MSLAIFGFMLLAAVIGLAWKNSRVMAAAVCALLLGVVVAGSGGPLASTSHQAVAALRSALSSLAASLI